MMKRMLKLIVVALVSCAVIAAVGQFFPSTSHATPGPTQVIVTNTPLPVSGTVTNPLDNSGNPVPLVTADPVYAAHNGFLVPASCSFGNTALCSGTIYTVPSGKIAVIQWFSGSCSLGASGDQLARVVLSLSDSMGGVGGLHIVPGPAVPDYEGTINQSFEANVTGYYLPQGVEFDLIIKSSQVETSAAGCSMDIGGYMVNQ